MQRHAPHGPDVWSRYSLPRCDPVGLGARSGAALEGNEVHPCPSSWLQWKQPEEDFHFHHQHLDLDDHKNENPNDGHHGYHDLGCKDKK